nr:hypothetical protein [Tanacetum cinerariifolium]
MKSDKVIKSSVEDLVSIPSESEGILDNMCDVPFSFKNHFDVESDLIESLRTRDTLIVYSPKTDSLLEEFPGELVHIDQIPPGIDEMDSDPKDDIRFIEQLLYDDTSSEDDSFEDINYVEASPPNSKLVSLEEAQDDILREKLLNIHLLIDKIESLNNNPTPDCVLKSLSSSFISYSDNSLPEFETFSSHTEETSSGSTTTHADNSLPEYDLFLFEIEPDQGELFSAAMKDILGEPRIYVPNVLPNHPTLYQDSDFSFSDNSLGSGLEVSFPFETRNKIFDPGIFIEVQSKRLLSREEFSISFIHDPLYPVFKHGILSYLLVSHQDKTASDFSKSPEYSLKSNPRDFYHGRNFLSHSSVILFIQCSNMSKSKVRQSRAKAVVAKVSTSSSTPAISSEVAKLKDMVRALLLDNKNQSLDPASSPTPTPVKAAEPNYVTCGGSKSVNPDGQFDGHAVQIREF